MFEVGKKYEVRMIIDGGETTMWRTIEKYEHPLVKFADENVRVFLPNFSDFENEAQPLDHKVIGEIINISSPNFISAVLKVDG